MMRLLPLTLLACILSISSSKLNLKYSLSNKTFASIRSIEYSQNDDESMTANIILQSKDGGQTWYDISQSLPVDKEPEGFFAGESELYLRVNNEMYSSKSSLSQPIWKKENMLDPATTSIAFSPAGVKALTYVSGKIFLKIPSGNWKSIYENFNRTLIRTIFETTDGNIFIGCDSGLYKSSDNGKNWKLVLQEGWVLDIAESGGVLVGTGQKGIMRSTDQGEHWDWVISEGGVGIDVTAINGGFAAISYNTTTQTRRIRISQDKGKTWRTIDAQFQSTFYIPLRGGTSSASLISSIKQVGKYLICGHPDGIYQSEDMGKTWNLVYPGVKNKVFTIYTSGSTLFAVLRSGGC